jgi:hypothetical protein
VPLPGGLCAERKRCNRPTCRCAASGAAFHGPYLYSYFHTLRINGWVGNLAAEVESEFFGEQGLGVEVDGRRRSSWEVKIKGLRVVTIIGRLNEQILPLLDRSNRTMIRNLKALDALRQRSTPSVSIGQAGQVTVATVQTNQGSPRQDDPRQTENHGERRCRG